MKRLALLFGMLMIGVTMNLSAQDIDAPIAEQSVDTLIVSDTLETSQLAQMPIYNPQSNAAAQVYNPPEDIHYNMPILGQQDTTESALENLPDLGKDLPQQWPGDINKDQKADSTERK